jgi:hypothetical protein
MIRHGIDGAAAAGPLEQADVLVLGDRHGPLGEHHRDAVLYPVAAPQPRVVQQSVLGEVEQAALVDGANQDL